MTDPPFHLCLPTRDPDARSYYHNAATGATSWEVPAGYGGGASASARKTAVTGKRGALGKKSAQALMSVADKLASRAKKFVGLRKADKAKSQPSAFARKRGGGAGLVRVAPVAAAAAPAAAAPEAAAAAASAWTEATHPETGQKYYYNATTGETSWTGEYRRPGDAEPTITRLNWRRPGSLARAAARGARARATLVCAHRVDAARPPGAGLSARSNHAAPAHSSPLRSAAPA